MASNHVQVQGEKGEAGPKHSPLNSTTPVYLPPTPALLLPEGEFQEHIKTLLSTSDTARNVTPEAMETDKSPKKRMAEDEPEGSPPPKSQFMDALLQNAARARSPTELAAENKTLTENADVAFVSTKSPLVELFYDLEGDTIWERVGPMLEKAWAEDPLATLKIIFHARSIHLGKSNRPITYRAFGWLAQNHPLTLLTNLRWLTRPVIEKKAPKPDEKKKTEDAAGFKKEEEDEDLVMVEADETKDKADQSPEKAYDVRYGVSHGYWKDLLNLLAIAAHNELKFDGKMKNVLNTHPAKDKKALRTREYDPKKAKEIRKEEKAKRHQMVLSKLENDNFYQALHLVVARLFATQLREDVALLRSENQADRKKISLAAKWAPTMDAFHDKHTFIVSAIAEILYPSPIELCPKVEVEDREMYLRHAREAYRCHIISPLRKALDVVERDIVAETFQNIKYERVPSLAMERYNTMFMKKDHDHFFEYIEKVAAGKSTISGAVLLPSTLVQKVIAQPPHGRVTIEDRAMAMVNDKVSDGQWNALVQRIRNSGKLESSIAVCDVSGSMGYPMFKDKTTPMHSAIGLSLLLAEIVEPPFGGTFITFSAQPSIVKVGGKDDPRTFKEKVNFIQGSNWSMNTNFVAVFEDLILPMAIEHKLKQEDMVKQVFVFSDMQFDAADTPESRWTTSFARIKKKYEDAGYQMPKLIFWNLASGRTGGDDYGLGTGQSKPVTADEVGTALVSGYSQAQMKMFLDNGSFDDLEVEEEVVEKDVVDEEGDSAVEIKVVKKEKMDPMTMVRKAISHKAYQMLEVVD